jgi:hypothetical protein
MASLPMSGSQGAAGHTQPDGENTMITAKRCLAVILLLAVAGGAESLTAQRALGGGGLGLRGLGPRLGENVDMALQHQDQLGLSAEQVAALQEIRAGIQRDVEPLQGLMDDLRGGILRGEVAGPQGWNQLQELWAEYDVAAEPLPHRGCERPFGHPAPGPPAAHVRHPRASRVGRRLGAWNRTRGRMGHWADGSLDGCLGSGTRGRAGFRPGCGVGCRPQRMDGGRMGAGTRGSPGAVRGFRFSDPFAEVGNDA